MMIYDYILEYLDDDIKNIDNNNICFIDIETTGLSRKHNFIYLIGLVYYSYNENGWKLIQYFADSKDEEVNILNEFNEFVKRFKIIITYNGDSFDIPFIKYRFSKYNIINNLYNVESLDIYRRIKQDKSYLKLKNLKLKTVENKLGICREDKYTGKDCINFYYQYLSTKDKNLLGQILKHNYDDLYYLLPVMKIFNVIEDSKSISIEKNNIEVKVTIKDIAIKGDMLQISCDTSITDDNVVHYTDFYNLQWYNNKLNIELECKKGMITPTKKCLYIDTSKLPFKENLKDLSQYMTPDHLMLLKVEHEFMIDNLKLIIREIISSI